ncbi:hypothetical protein V5O48_009851 [Marasmius crinis-equi]|uniref:Uncharacterized protein n=1 Tax=Marasmius crinis-equi TaxID=585013 RepID=A0ABR3FA13_9AGAR
MSQKAATADVNDDILLKNLADENFLNRSKIRLPNVTSAITALRHINILPSSVPDPSRPLSQVEDVLVILASLQVYADRYGTTAYLRINANWASLIGPWVRYLIEGFILVKEGPSTLKGVEGRGHSLIYIPLLLFGRKMMHWTEYLEIRRMDRRLYPLVVHVWLKLIDEFHRACTLWADVLSELHGVIPDRGWLWDADLLRYAPYKDATPSQLGMMYVRHLNHLATIGCSVPSYQISSFSSHLRLLCHTLDGKDRLSPLQEPGVLRYSVLACVNLATLWAFRCQVHCEVSMSCQVQVGPGLHHSHICQRGPTST